MEKIENTIKRIFIISPTESILTKRGNRHPVLAEKLVEKGHDVIYLTTDFYHAEKRKFEKDELELAKKQAKYRIYFFSNIAYDDNVSLARFAGNIKVAIAMFFFLIGRINKNDSLLVSSRPPEFVFVVNLLRIFCGVNIILDVRDVWPEGLPLKNTLTHHIFSSYCKLLYFFSARGYKKVTYTATGFLQWINKFCKKSNPSFIPIGFDGERWTDCRPIEHIDKNDKIRMIYLGDLAKSMDIKPLFYSIAGRENYSLTFIGGGEQLDELKSEVTNMNISNIHFKGFIPRDQVVVELKRMHILVIPMKVKFVMPNKLFDAIGSYKPILVFGKNDTTDFVKLHDIGWTLPFNKAYVSNFLDSLDIFSIMDKSKNISLIREKYTKDYLYEKMINILFQ